MDQAQRPRRRRVVVAGGAVLAGAGFLAWSLPRLLGGSKPSSPLAGRLGDSVGSFDGRYAHPGVGSSIPANGTAAYRRVYDAAGLRIVADVATDGLVRQLTISLPRDVADTFEPAPGDWTLTQAREVAARWLPADCRKTGSGPFAFQEREIGVRDTFSSAALARRVPGSGQCAASYYQTRAGTVAFALIGVL